MIKSLLLVWLNLKEAVEYPPKYFKTSYNVNKIYLGLVAPLFCCNVLD